MKYQRMAMEWTQGMSPPSRGAWIEMLTKDELRKARSRRPPRGGRGLKYDIMEAERGGRLVAPLAGGVD